VRTRSYPSRTSLAEPVLADREWARFPAYMRSLVGLVRAAGVSFLATSETAGTAPALTLNQVTITDAGLIVGDRMKVPPDDSDERPQDPGSPRWTA
jgi:hypothetical protein